MLSTLLPVALGWCGLLPAAAVENVSPIPSATPQLPYLMFVRLSPAPICAMPTRMSLTCS